MKKIFTAILSLAVFYSSSRAQDTIFSQDFEVEDISFMIFDFPSAVPGDTNYYNTDEDGLDDASTLGNRPGQWFLTFGFSGADTLNTILASNSWTNHPATPVKNWLVLPVIQITDTSAMLSWKSAPFQTPYFLDGYKVLVSTTTNDLFAFTDTLFVASEFVSGPFDGETNCCSGGDYSLYTFSPGFVHGLDSTFIEYNDDGDGLTGSFSAGDSARNTGVLRPHSVSLAQYDGQQIYIAFLHDSHDDNLIGIDEIMVTEHTDPTFGLGEQDVEFEGSVYPNPADQWTRVTFDAERYHHVKVELLDQRGVLIHSSLSLGTTEIPTSALAAGLYYVKVTADEGAMVRKLIVRH